MTIISRRNDIPHSGGGLPFEFLTHKFYEKNEKKTGGKKSISKPVSKKVEVQNYQDKFTEWEDHYDPEYPFEQQEKSNQTSNRKNKR